MIAADFDYQSPCDLSALLKLLGGEETKVLAGGMTLVPMLNLGLVEPSLLIGLRALPELTGICEEADHIRIGAMTRHMTVSKDPLVGQHVPLLGLAAGLIGDVQVRNRGTMGGSLAHADPAANYLPVVIALDARLELVGPRGPRAVVAGDFFRDTMTTALESDEVIVSVCIPKGCTKRGVGFQKFTRVKGNFPIVCAAALAEVADGPARVVIGGVTPVPISVDVSAGTLATEQAMNSLAAAIRAAIIDPLEDQNGDAEYKREMAVVFGLRAFSDALRDREYKSRRDDH